MHFWSSRRKIWRLYQGMTAGAASSMFQRIVLQGRMHVHQARPQPVRSFSTRFLSPRFCEYFQCKVRKFPHESTTTSLFLLSSNTSMFHLVRRATPRIQRPMKMATAFEWRKFWHVRRNDIYVPEAIECELNPPSSSSRAAQYVTNACELH